ncbi:MAG: MerR family transcriptional regulator [Oligoflexia bacterium]|nr:MerR family transcriptional regulator [Oligoflexia bacterium]
MELSSDQSIMLPRKSLFKVEEVCVLTGVKLHVLKFWESEFPELSPIASASGQKLYEERDIELILFIKKRLLEENVALERVRGELMELFPSHPGDASSAGVTHAGVTHVGVTHWSKRATNSSVSSSPARPLPVATPPVLASVSISTSAIEQILEEASTKISALLGHIEQIKEKHSWKI